MTMQSHSEAHDQSNGRKARATIRKAAQAAISLAERRAAFQSVLARHAAADSKCAPSRGGNIPQKAAKEMTASTEQLILSPSNNLVGIAYKLVQVLKANPDAGGQFNRATALAWLQDDSMTQEERLLASVYADLESFFPPLAPAGSDDPNSFGAAKAALERINADPDTSDEANEMAADAEADLFHTVAPDVAAVLYKLDLCEDLSGRFYRDVPAIDLIKADLWAIAGPQGSVSMGGPSSEWSEALAAFERATCGSREFSAHLDSVTGDGGSVTEEMEEQWEAADDRRVDAWRTLMRTQAPTPAAIAVKMRHAMTMVWLTEIGDDIDDPATICRFLGDRIDDGMAEFNVYLDLLRLTGSTSPALQATPFDPEAYAKALDANPDVTLSENGIYFRTHRAPEGDAACLAYNRLNDWQSRAVGRSIRAIVRDRQLDAQDIDDTLAARKLEEAAA